MKKEDLLALLQQAGLDNDSIVALLNEVIADLSGANEPVPEDNKDDEKAQVLSMLGAN